jgi:hypothetical protein
MQTLGSRLRGNDGFKVAELYYAPQLGSATETALPS